MTSKPERGRGQYRWVKSEHHAAPSWEECWQALDAGVGKVVAALKRSGLYDNSIIIFSTDNGGVGNGASNLPLRGAKESLFEGGVRGVAFLHSPLLATSGREHEGWVRSSPLPTLTDCPRRLIYITDWYATILGLAGLENSIPKTVDSFNLWESLSHDVKSPREEIVLNLDQVTPSYSNCPIYCDISIRILFGILGQLLSCKNSRKI